MSPDDTESDDTPAVPKPKQLKKPSRLAKGPMTLGYACRVPSALGDEGPGLKSNPKVFLFCFAEF